MNRSILLAAILLACSCSQSQTGSETANEAADASEAAAPAEAVPALVGEWRVAAIDGRPVDAASAMIATFREGKLQVASGCLRRAWSYTQQRNMVSFTPDPAGSSNCGAPPSGDQENAYAALELATMAIFGKDGSEASLSGNGGTVTLERR